MKKFVKEDLISDERDAIIIIIIILIIIMIIITGCEIICGAPTTLAVKG